MNRSLFRDYSDNPYVYYGPTRGQTFELHGEPLNTFAEDFQHLFPTHLAETSEGPVRGLSEPLREGIKLDGDKLPFHLIAPEMLEETAKVLQFGAKKYAPRNWELGMAWSRPYSALMRHMWAWWRGEHIDPETGFSHLSHALCCIMFLSVYEKREVGTDDRPKSNG